MARCVNLLTAAKIISEYTNIPLHELVDIMTEVPSEDVAPVRHGHWNIGYFHDRVCSRCLHPDNDLNDYAHGYCPNCGAKMDGDPYA